MVEELEVVDFSGPFHPNCSDPNHSMIHLLLRAEGKECSKYFQGVHEYLKQQKFTDLWERGEDHEILTVVSLSRIIEEYFVLSQFRARFSGFHVCMRQGGEKAFHKTTLKEVEQGTVKDNRHKDVPIWIYPLLYPQVGPIDWDFCSPQ